MDTGRVFFLREGEHLTAIRAVTLESHQNNVTCLARAWSAERAFLQAPAHLRAQLSRTRDKLIRAAQRHDEGKRRRFRIERANSGDLYYSYRGHRFEVTDPDLYVELLIRLHHNAYSVDDINEAIARLRLSDDQREFAELFPLDAYALQMCDQLTAEVEVYALDTVNPRRPEFMEFKTEKLDDTRVAVDPYPFDRSPLVLTVEYADLQVNPEYAHDPSALTKQVKQTNSETLTKKKKEVELCPLLQVSSATSANVAHKEKEGGRAVSVFARWSWRCFCRHKEKEGGQAVSSDRVKLAYQQVVGFDPNPMQRAMFERIASGDCAVLLKAPTGSGKTEAVLVPALAGLLDGGEPRRLFQILPTRSLVEDQAMRIERVLSKLSSQVQRPLALVVDSGGQSYRKVWKGGKQVEQRTRHLYDGDVVITTLDKFLYRFFGFGEPFKSYIFPLRIHYGARRSLLCFDEAHTYEDTAFVNFVNLAYTLAIKKGLDVVVMTATMPESYAKQLNFLEEIDYVENSQNLQALSGFYNYQHDTKQLAYIPCTETELVDKLVQQAEEHYAPDRRVIVTAELVEDAIRVYEELGKQLQKQASLYLYHGRIPDVVFGDQNRGRRRIYAELKERDQKGEGYLLVTTSAIEVGCDLNAHVLITELCNPDQLVQRAGRCNRKGNIPNAKIIVVGNRIKPFLSDLDREAQRAYVETLKGLSVFDQKKILEHLAFTVHTDHRAQMLFDMLYEYVYEAELVYKGLHEKGFVITRSWEPSVTLFTELNEDGHPCNLVSVSLRSLINWSGAVQSMPDCKLYRRFYDGDDSHRVSLQPITSGHYCAYFLDLYLQVPKSCFDPATGYKEVPKVFKKVYTEGYREVVSFATDPSSQPSSQHRSASAARLSLWYLRPARIDQPEP